MSRSEGHLLITLLFAIWGLGFSVGSMLWAGHAYGLWLSFLWFLVAMVCYLALASIIGQLLRNVDTRPY